MIDEQVWRIWSQPRRQLLCRRSVKAPRRRKLRVKKKGAFQNDATKYLREGIHAGFVDAWQKPPHSRQIDLLSLDGESIPSVARACSASATRRMILVVTRRTRNALNRQTDWRDCDYNHIQLSGNFGSIGKS